MTIDTATGHDGDGVMERCGHKDELAQNGYAVFCCGSTTRGKDSRHPQRTELLQRFCFVWHKVKGTMESERQTSCGLHQTSSNR